MGLDPLYIANEGKLLVIAPENQAANILKAMKQHPEGRNSMIIGKITDEPKAGVIMETAIGTKRIVDMPSGEQLPRIC